jgi:hypothetical protein
MLRQRLVNERGRGSRGRFDRAVSSERLAWWPGSYGFSMFRLDERLENGRRELGIFEDASAKTGRMR